MADIFNMTDTWNAGGTSFTAIKLNVTDSASASGSLLLDLQVGGVSKASITKQGHATLAGNLTVNGTYIYTPGALLLASASNINFNSDTYLYRDAANTLALRNSTNAQALNIYNTYTDASNYELLRVAWVTNVMQIGTVAAGTGTVRPLEINAGTYMNLNIGGVNKFGVGGASNVSYQTLSISHALSGSQAVSSIDAAPTWNTSGTPTAIKLNVTDTASNASSLLLDLQVGGTSKFKVTKAGAIGYDGTSDQNMIIQNGVTLLRSADTATRLYAAGGLSAGSTFTAQIDAGGGSHFRALSGNATTTYFQLYGEAANTLALRNSTNAQAFNIYNTYTDASNYERGFFKYSSNVLEIGHQAAGTGNADRTIRLVNGGVSRLEVTGSGNIKLGSSSSLEFAERTAPSAPGANGVYVYAQDNGAGKTQLMALFASGAAQQIAIEP